MADKKGSSMPSVDMTKEFTKLNEADQHFIKKLETLNADRAKGVKHLRYRNKYTGFALGALVLGIYSYTILSVKQEKFLDDFDNTQIKKSST
jgi:hypothetical protein